MRNLKRALSLALASVMLVGMMVVGTSASYQDVTSEYNKEAIEVLQAVGVMVGDDNGDFNPDQNVTRNEMAVIMANLMDYRVASYAGTSPFTDVPAWAEPYVAACYTNGITAGVSATTYGGNNSVTTSQAALMLMKALGYFQYASDFSDDWQLATIKQGNLIALFDGVKSGSIEAMTRNDVAQLVLNTLKAGMVQAEKNGQDISVSGSGIDVNVTGSVSYVYITSGETYAKAIKTDRPVYSTSISTSGYIVELGEKLYNGNLKLDDTTADNFGAPANKWTYKSAEVGTYAEDADYVFTGEAKSKAVYSAVSKNVANNYDWAVYVDGVNVTNKKNDDGDTFLAQVQDNNSDTLANTARGNNTYVYIDDDAEEVVVCIVNTYAAEISKYDDGTITLDDADDGSLDFDIEGYDEEDVVLYTKSYDSNGDATVEEILGLAKLIEGEATTIRNADKVTVDGTTYSYSSKFNDVNGDKLGTDSVDNDVAFYLDAQGNIIMMEDANESGDYAYVYSIGSANSLYGDDDEYGAKLILADGTIVSVSLDSDTTDDYANLAAVQKAFLNKIVSYTVEKDGSYSLTVKSAVVAATYGTGKDDVIENGKARVYVSGTKSIYADKNTIFLINEDGDDNDDFSVYVGYNNVPNVDAGKTTGVAYYTKSGVAKVIVLTNASATGAATDVVFIKGDNAKVNKTGSTEYYTYDAVVDGEIVSIDVKANSEAATEIAKLAKNEIGIYFGLTVNSSGYVTKVTTNAPNDVDVDGPYTGTKRVSTGGNVTFNTAGSEVSYAASDNALIVYIDGKNLSIESRVKTDANDIAKVILDDGEVIAILVKVVD